MNIKNLRQLRGMSQEELADVIGYSPAYISGIENGKRTGVAIRVYQSIAEALDVPLYMLFVDQTNSLETVILAFFRQLPEERKQGWLDLVSSEMPHLLEEAQKPG